MIKFIQIVTYRDYTVYAGLYHIFGPFIPLLYHYHTINSYEFHSILINYPHHIYCWEKYSPTIFPFIFPWFPMISHDFPFIFHGSLGIHPDPMDSSHCSHALYFLSNHSPGARPSTIRLAWGYHEEISHLTGQVSWRKPGQFPFKFPNFMVLTLNWELRSKTPGWTPSLLFS